MIYFIEDQEGIGIARNLVNKTQSYHSPATKWI